MSVTPDLVVLAERLARALEDASIEYAIGGALALGIWAEARGTKDIDISVFVPDDQLDRVLPVLQRVGADIDRGVCQWQLKTWGHLELTAEPFRVDVFIPDFALYDWAYRRRRQVMLGTSRVWFWAPEDLLLFKLVFFRSKDKVDIESLVSVQREKLDLNYIRKALREILAEEERTRWFEDLVREILGP